MCTFYKVYPGETRGTVRLRMKILLFKVNTNRDIICVD